MTNIKLCGIKCILFSESLEQETYFPTSFSQKLNTSQENEKTQNLPDFWKSNIDFIKMNTLNEKNKTQWNHIYKNLKGFSFYSNYQEIFFYWNKETKKLIIYLPNKKKLYIVQDKNFLKKYFHNQKNQSWITHCFLTKNFNEKKDDGEKKDETFTFWLLNMYIPFPNAFSKDEFQWIPLDLSSDSGKKIKNSFENTLPWKEIYYSFNNKNEEIDFTLSFENQENNFHFYYYPIFPIQLFKFHKIIFEKICKSFYINSQTIGNLLFYKKKDQIHFSIILLSNSEDIELLENDKKKIHSENPKYKDNEENQLSSESNKNMFQDDSITTSILSTNSNYEKTLLSPFFLEYVNPIDITDEYFKLKNINILEILEESDEMKEKLKKIFLSKEEIEKEYIDSSLQKKGFLTSIDIDSDIYEWNDDPLKPSHSISISSLKRSEWLRSIFKKNQYTLSFTSYWNKILKLWEPMEKNEEDEWL